MPLRMSNLNSNLALTLGYLNPALNNSAQASSVKLFNSLQWLPFYEKVKIAKCCVAYKRIKVEVPLYIEDFLRLNSRQHRRVTRCSNIILFAQNLIGRPKAVGRSQFVLVNSGTA